jgi:hypothetical protein
VHNRTPLERALCNHLADSYLDQWTVAHLAGCLKGQGLDIKDFQEVTDGKKRDNERKIYQAGSES